MITLTENAVIQLKRFSAEQDIGHLCIRVKTIGKGCSGLSNDMTFEEKEFITEMDEVFEQDGITIVVDCLSHSYMQEVELDYISETFGEGFKFNFKNEAIKSCGCSESFGY